MGIIEEIRVFISGCDANKNKDEIRYVGKARDFE